MCIRGSAKHRSSKDDFRRAIFKHQANQNSYRQIDMKFSTNDSVGKFTKYAAEWLELAIEVVN
jgi:hypothetical protein